MSHKLQRDGSRVADVAFGLPFLCRQMRDHVSKIAVVCGPQRDQQQPVNLLRCLYAHVPGLIVSRKSQRWLQRCTNESLMIV